MLDAQVFQIISDFYLNVQIFGKNYDKLCFFIFYISQYTSKLVLGFLVLDFLDLDFLDLDFLVSYFLVSDFLVSTFKFAP